MMDDPVNIRGLKRFAVDHAGERCRIRLPAASTGKKGGGDRRRPGRNQRRLLSDADGTPGDDFRAEKAPGRYAAVRHSKLPPAQERSWIRRSEQILDLGIEVKTEVTVGESPNIRDLREAYDAVYIAIGAHTLTGRSALRGKTPRA